MKDGFLLYYGEKRPKTAGFDIHVKGAIPLANCTVEALPSAKELQIPDGHFAFRLANPDFGDSSMILAVSSEQSLADWMKVCREGSSITFANAKLGHAMIKKLQKQGTASDVSLAF